MDRNSPTKMNKWGVEGSNLDPCIYYVISLPTELNSQRQLHTNLLGSESHPKKHHRNNYAIMMSSPFFLNKSIIVGIGSC